jgi:Family of unknown function (DUF5719)
MRLPRPVVTAAAAAGLVVGLVAVTAVASPDTSATSATEPGLAASTHPITSADLVCPVPATAKGVSQAVVSAGATGHATGTLSLYRLSGPVTALPVAEAPAGSPLLRYVEPAGKAAQLVLRATGSYAPGLTAAVTTRVASGPNRSLQSAPCVAASGEAWFVGGGASVGRRSVLTLTNIDAASATVDVTVYTAQGAQLPTPVQGVTVGAKSSQSFPLDFLVPGAAATAVHVVTRSGRVAATLADSQVNGLQAQGADWVPASQGPGRRDVVTGVPGDADAKRTLGLVVPGSDDAVVSVHLLTAGGTLSPPELQGLAVPAGKLMQIVVGAAQTGGGPFGVVVESDRPVVAGVRTVRTPTGAGNFPDFSYAASTTPVEGTLLLPTTPHTATVTTQLQLTAPGDNDVVVNLTTTTGAAATDQRVTVTAGTTLAVPVGPVSATGSSMLVETAAGADPLYAGWVLAEAGTHGPMVTGGPLPQTPLTLFLPAVAADPAAGYSGH